MKRRNKRWRNASTSAPSSPVFPDQQVFHQYLRTLAQSAVRIVLETVMHEELEQFIFENLPGARAIQTEIARDDQLVDGRLAFEVLQHCFKRNLIPVNIRDDSDTHVISL